MKIIFDIWPSCEEMARDINQLGVTVRAWKARNSIPAEFDVSIVDAARKRGSLLDYEHLARLRRGETDISIGVAVCNSPAAEASQ